MDQNIQEDIGFSKEADITKESGLQSIQLSKDINIDKTSASTQVAQQYKPIFPIEATPKVATYIKENSANAAAVQNDVENFSNIERLVGKVVNQPIKTLESNNVARSSYDLMTYDNGLGLMSSIKSDIDRDKKTDSMADSMIRLGDLSKYDKPDDSIIGIDLIPGIESVFVGIYDAIKNNPKLATTSAVSGAAGGALLGIGAVGTAFASTIATTSAKDNFEITAGDIYKSAYLDLSPGDKLKADKKEIMYIALGAGAVTGGIELFTGAMLAKTAEKAAENAILKNISKKQIIEAIKKGITKSTALNALSKIGKTLTEQFLEQGVTEGLQQVTQNVATDYANPTQQITVEGSFKDVFGSMVVGTLAGATTHYAGSATGTIKKGADNLGTQGSIQNPFFGYSGESDVVTTIKPQPIRSEAERVLYEKLTADKRRLELLKNTITEINDIQEKITIKNTVANEEIMTSIGKDLTVSLSKDAIVKMEQRRKGFVSTFEKITGQKIIDENDIYNISGKELLNLFQYDEDVLNNVSEKPGTITLNDYEKYRSKLDSNQELIQTLLAKKGIKETTPEEAVQIDKQINEIVESSMEGIYNIPTSVDRPVIPEDIKVVVPKIEKQQIEDGVKSARESVAKEIKSDVMDQIKKTISLDVQTEMENNAAAIDKEIKDNNGFKVEEAFDPATPVSNQLVELLKNINPVYKEMSEASIQVDIKSKHKNKKSASLIAFDPKTVPENYLAETKKQRVKDKGAFTPGGIDWNLYGDVVAKYLGFNTKEELLNNLVKTETKDEYLKRRVDEDLKAQYALSSEDLKPTQEDFEKAFQDKAKIQEMEVRQVMKEEQISMQKLIKLFGRRLKPVQELITTATYLVYGMKTRNLDHSIARANEQIFRKKAADSLRSGDFESYFRFKEKETLAGLVESQIIKTRQEITRKLTKIKSISNKESRAVLYTAGTIYVDAFDALKNALGGKPLGTSKIQDILKIYEPYIQMGNVLPEKIVKLGKDDAKVQQGDLNAQELLGILDAIIQVHAIAKDVTIFKIESELLTKLEMENYVAQDLRPRKDYNTERSTELRQADNTEKKFLYQKYVQTKDFLFSLTSAMKIYGTTITNTLDRGNVKGLYTKTLIDNVSNSLNKKSEMKQIQEDYFLQKIRETIGVKKFQTYTGHTPLREDFLGESSTTIYIPELTVSPAFKGGQVTKMNLLMMLGHYGNKSGRERISNDLGISENQYLEILKKYTTPEDLRFVESVHNYFDQYDYKERKARAERMGFEAPKKIIGESFEIHGKITNGGYWPIVTQSNLIDKARNGLRDWVDLVKGKSFVDKIYTSDINTSDGHDLARQESSSSPINYSWEGFQSALNEKMHHAAFGETMLTISKFLGSESIATDIVNTIGVNDFANMLSILQNIGNGNYEYSVNFQQQMNGLFNTVNKNLYVYHLGYGVKTTAKQFLSLPVMIDGLSQILKGGLTRSNYQAIKYILEPMAKLAFRPRAFGEAVQAIALKDAQFKNYTKSLSKNRFFRWAFDLDESLDVRPTGGNDLQYFIDNAKDASLEHLSAVQLYINTAMYMGVYNAAMNGQINGIDQGDMNGSNLIAGQMVRKLLSDDSAMGQSSLQSSDFGKLLFFARNQMNLVTNQFMGAAQRVGIETREGDVTATTKGMLGGIQTLIATSVAPAAMTVIADAIWDKIVSSDKKDDKKDDEEGTEAIKKLPFNKPEKLDWLQSMALESLSPIPFVSDFAYSIKSATDFGIRPEDLKNSNPYFSLPNELYQVGVSFIVAGSDNVRLTDQQAKNASQLLAKLIGFPKFNMIATPADPYGQALQNKVINTFVEKLSLPVVRQKAYEDRRSSIVQGTNVDSWGASPAVEMSGEPAKSIKTEDFDASVFNQVVEKINSKELDQENLELFKQYRDIIYSKKGVTNPEGNVITTTKGEINLTDKEREDLTIWTGAISRFETADGSQMVSASGASGYYHFTNSTWNGLRESYPDFQLPERPDLATKAQQDNIYWKFLGENLKDLEKFGQPKTLENVYLIHMMGRNDFKTFTDASNDQDLTDVLPLQFRWNGGIMAGKTKDNVKSEVIKRLTPYLIKSSEFLYNENLLTLD